MMPVRDAHIIIFLVLVLPVIVLTPVTLHKRDLLRKKRFVWGEGRGEVDWLDFEMH